MRRLAGRGQPLHFAPRAKRVIYLYMAGGPSHLETFDYKPKLAEMHGQPMPESFTKGQPIAQLQGRKLTCLAPQHPFEQCGKSGQEISSVFPQLAEVADEMCIVRSLHTEAINHDPAHTFMNTGTTISGRPAMGSWLTYGLGSESDDLPGFVVLTSLGKFGQAQPIAARQWHSGFLPSRFQGVEFRSQGRSGAVRRQSAGRRSRSGSATWSTPSRRSTTAGEPGARRSGNRHAHQPVRNGLPHADQRAGPDGRVGRAGARARPVRHAGGRWLVRAPIACWPGGWPSAACASFSSIIATGIITAASRSTSRERPREVDRGAGGLDPRSQAARHARRHADRLGRRIRPHADGAGQRPRPSHARAFRCGWPAAASSRGISYGATDEFGYNAVENPVHVHDLHATMLHLLGIDHTRLTYRFQGRDFRLTDVAGNVVRDILA